METFLLLFFGLITGLIDSIVGGGGLISLPFLSMMIAPGAPAVATNKILGTIGALVALIVYWIKGHLKIRSGIWFCILCAFGSFLGSSTTPYFPISIFNYFLIAICPIILYIVWNKDKYFNEQNKKREFKWYWFISSAILTGFYDGAFGPGGGTFMFLSLYLLTGLPLLNSIAISKLANSFSAGTALLTFAGKGHVHWREGLLMGLAMGVGAYIGASFNTKNSAKIVRPALVVVVTLLLAKLLFT
jgi:uncharacterized membrane protein YfcA